MNGRRVLAWMRSPSLDPWACLQVLFVGAIPIEILGLKGAAKVFLSNNSQIVRIVTHL